MEISEAVNSEVNVNVGDTVYVGSGTERIGKVEFIGETKFSSGIWVGVNLFTPNGKNDGSVSNERYFTCKPSHGIFSKPTNIRLAIGPTGDGGNGIEVHNGGKSIAKSQSSTDTNAESPGSSAGSFVRIGIHTFRLGDRVQVSGGRCGILRFFGTTDFAPGEWVGLELSEPNGKNDGSVGGRRYFTCEQNHGLFAAANRIVPLSGGLNRRDTELKNSQESLLSYSSNLSSVSRSYRAQQGTPGIQGQHLKSDSRRTSNVNLAARRESVSNIQVLQRLIKEKEAYIEQLLHEREVERSDLARATVEHEKVEAEAVTQRAIIQKLNIQLEEMEANLQQLREENEQIKLKLHEERRNLEDLQFRMEEERIDKTTLESQTVDDESKIFELEEALALARETNERTEAELSDLRNQLTSLQQQHQITEQHREVVSGESSDTQVQAKESIKDDSVDKTDWQEQCKQLRATLANHEAELEASIQHQTSVLDSIKADYDQQIEQLTNQLSESTKELATIKQTESDVLTGKDQTQAALNTELEEVRKQFAEQQLEANAQIVKFESVVSELNHQLEEEKSNNSLLSAANVAALREVEAKLKIAECQLAEYQNRVLSDAQSFHHHQNEIASRLDQSDTQVQALLARIQSQEILLNTQRERLNEAESAYQAVIQENQSSEAAQNLIKLKDADLLESQSKQMQLKRQLEEAHETRDNLLQTMNALLKDLNLSNTNDGVGGGDDNDNICLPDSMSRKLTQHICDMQEKLQVAEQMRMDLENRCHTLETRRNELENELARVNITLENANEFHHDNTALKQELDTVRSKLKALELSAADTFAQLECKSNELKSVQNRLEKVQSEQSELEKVHNHAIFVLESEKSLLLERLHKVGDGVPINLPDSNSLPMTNSIVVDSTTFASDNSNNGDDHLLKSTTANGSSPQSQINFLNSIIVDLHAKNEELESRVRAMLAGVGDCTQSSVDRLPSKSSQHVSSSRLWCDNCLIFDSHDTTDCPDEPTSHKPYNTFHKLNSVRDTNNSDRIYCDNCGLFDNHVTEECTDAQTF